MVTIPAAERDLDLPDKLKQEWGGILQWMIEGAIKWQSRGLIPPPACRAATSEYLEDESLIKAWIEENCEAKANSFVSTKVLFRDWREWCEARGEFVGSMKTFSQDLEKVPGVLRDRTAVARGFFGLQLRGEYRPPDFRNRGAV